MLQYEHMTKTYLYIPDDLNKQIELAAKLQKKSKAEVMRKALLQGLKAQQRQGSDSVNAFLKLAEIGRENPMHGPKDSASRIDELLWDRDWGKGD